MTSVHVDIADILSAEPITRDGLSWVTLRLPSDIRVVLQCFTSSQATMIADSYMDEIEARCGN